MGGASRGQSEAARADTRSEKAGRPLRTRARCGMVRGVDVTIAVLAVDDHPIFADALRARLTAEKDLYPVTVAYNATDALLKVQTSRVDVALLDYTLNDGTGVTLALDIARDSPDTSIVMLSALNSADAVIGALGAGARAWARKTIDTATLVHVIRRVHAGEMWLDPETLGLVIPRLLYLAFNESEDPLDFLTPRELEVLECMSEAMRRPDIAARLGVSENTVRTHVQNMLSKLGVHTSVEAVSLMLRSPRYRHLT